MALKYRVVYGDYAKYKQKSSLRKVLRLLFSLLLCAAFVLYLMHSQNATLFFELILPGDPEVTTDAFRQLSASVSRGDALTEALNVFCETIMDIR